VLLDHRGYVVPDQPVVLDRPSSLGLQAERPWLAGTSTSGAAPLLDCSSYSSSQSVGLTRQGVVHHVASLAKYTGSLSKFARPGSPFEDSNFILISSFTTTACLDQRGGMLHRYPPVACIEIAQPMPTVEHADVGSTRIAIS
jgi:hypothetical protein